MATPSPTNYPPHPLLKEPVLYVADPPKHVQWGQLKITFSRCGKVITYGKNLVQNLPEGAPKREKYPVRFESLFEAEMALATLQGEPVEGVNPPWSLVLSHSPTLESALPTCRRWPQRVIPNVLPTDIWPGTTTAQSIFTWFRSVGPLVSVRINMTVGNSQNATVIEYWNKAHSDIAGAAPNLVHSAILYSIPRIPRLTLRFFDPCTVRCSGAVFFFGKIGKADSYATARRILMENLAAFGDITRVHFSKLGEGLNDIVSFESPQSAAQVLSAMSRDISCIRYYHRFEYYDGPELPSDSSEWPATDPVPSQSPSPPTEHPTMDDTTRPQSTPESPNSHPLLSNPILYIANPPNHVVWDRLQAEFSSRGCGAVHNLGKSTVEGKPGSFKWAVRFKTLMQAEKALATMQETLAVKSSPLWTIILSHSPTLSIPSPSDPILSQYLQSDPRFFAMKVKSQQLFNLFRQAGPLVSIRMNADIGNKVQTAVVQYWYEDHANTARMTYTTMHKKKVQRPPFSLRTFDPCGLRCSGFGPLVTPKDLQDAFSGFGNITSTSLDAQKSGTHGIVTFSRPADAALALQAMDGRLFRGSVMTVRYEEPGAQHVFRRPTKQSSSPANDSGGAPGATADVPPPRPSPEQLRREAHARELKEAAERRAKEASARATAEAKVKRHQEILLRKEEAERMNVKAKQDIESATTKRQVACEDLDLAKQAQEMADQELVDTQKACAEAKRIWLEAMDREVAATRKARDALEVSNEALVRKQDAEASMKIAQKQEVSSRIDAEKLKAELDQYVVDEETLRQVELAESIRRMAELRQIEQREKEEALHKEQREEEEISRREREEAERLISEQREREEQTRREAEARQRRYEQAVRTEQVRCRTADLQFWRSSTANQWNEQRALERFKFFSDDFDTVKFHDLQPLTFENVPWPILVQPRAMTFEAIDWSAVEKFFDAIEKLMQDRAEFRALVEKAHRRFHPDKWRARGILSSVWDDDLRGQLEAAGNVVAQAITPLWLKARQA